MDDIQYVGELLVPGNIGRLSVVSALVMALAATIAYFVSTNKQDLAQKASWKRLGRLFFSLHSVSVLGIIGALFYLLAEHRFEYHYVWEHSSLDLPVRYLLSCFWEGQEGSFLLWTFWHAVLGIIIMFKAKKWEAPVLTIFSVTQVFLMSMILGLWVFDVKLGSNPFSLLRDTMQAPIFSRPDYLSYIEDGSGLNPLLQNYWMTIHPPVLFLGFASTIIPFAYAIAGMWTRDYTGWVKPVLPWASFSTMILGVGILMGGAWAYESLTFGGFWAWDPVENASLVPWLTLVAGLHTLVAYKSTQHGLVATFVLFVSTFLLILYSTFLTRSGILGDTSVHAFTDLGMSGHLLIFMFFYVILSAVLLIYNWKKIPQKKEEESLNSREFWMFVGALVFSISAIQISFTTSIPVFNKIFAGLSDLPGIGSWFADLNWAPPTDVVGHYNAVQVWVAIILGILTAIVQFFKYRKTNTQKMLKAIATPAVIAVVLTAAVILLLKIYYLPYILMTFAGLYTITANIDYMITVLKSKPLVSGGSITHVGFGLMLLGILISNEKQQVISQNTTVDFGDAFDEKAKRENILLRLNEPVAMGDYFVTYIGDTIIAPNTYYKVDYIKRGKEGEIEEQFTLMPNAQINPNMGIVANPDTRHYWTKDVYTHVTSVPDKEAIEADLDSFTTHTVKLGDTLILAKAFAVIEQINTEPEFEERQEGDIAIGIRIKLQNPSSGNVYYAEPVFVIRDRELMYYADDVEELGTRIQVQTVLPDTEEFVIGVAEQEDDGNFIIMKAIVFPYINLLWLGCLVMVVGFTLSIIRRAKDNKRTLKQA